VGEDVHEGLLGHVERFVMVVQEAHRKRGDRIPEAPHQLLEGFLVASLEQKHQVLGRQIAHPVPLVLATTSRPAL
jgi:hypothetical protein